MRSYWWATSTVVSGVGCGEFVTVAPPNVTPRMGRRTPTKRSRMPPLGRLPLESRTKLTVSSGGWAMRSLFCRLAMVALSE